jgi:hypothetical protein
MKIIFLLMLATLAAVLPDRNAAAEPKKAASRKPQAVSRDTLPDVALSFSDALNVAAQKTPEVLSYTWLPKFQDNATGVQVRFNSHLKFFDIQKPITLRVVHFAANAPLGTVGMSHTIANGVRIIGVNFPKFGDYRIELFQGSCRGIYYDFHFFSGTDCTPISQFLPHTINCE